MLQPLLNGIYSGSQYALMAVGLTLIYSTAGFLNFAHGATYAIGAYATLIFINGGMSLVPAIIFGIVAAVVGAGVVELSLYRSLRKRKAGSLEALIASLGLFIVSQSVLAIVFGDKVRMLRSVTVSVGENLLGGHLTRVQLIGIAGSIILCVLTLGFLRYSLIGRQARAISDDLELAKAFGVRTERIIFYTVLIAAVLAGFAAVIAGYDIDVRPTMGFYPLLLGVVVMLIGGVGSIGGAIIAAYFVALIQQVSVSFLPTKWQDVIVFIVLILFLLLRPQGFFGKDQQTIHL